MVPKDQVKKLIESGSHSSFEFLNFKVKIGSNREIYKEIHLNLLPLSYAVQVRRL